MSSRAARLKGSTVLPGSFESKFTLVPVSDDAVELRCAVCNPPGSVTLFEYPLSLAVISYISRRHTAEEHLVPPLEPAGGEESKQLTSAMSFRVSQGAVRAVKVMAATDRMSVGEWIRRLVLAEMYRRAHSTQPPGDDRSIASMRALTEVMNALCSRAVFRDAWQSADDADTMAVLRGWQDVITRELSAAGDAVTGAVTDWTTTSTGMSNSSAEFTGLVSEVTRLLWDGAGSYVLSHDWVHGKARLIMAQLAHVHGLAPRGAAHSTVLSDDREVAVEP